MGKTRVLIMGGGLSGLAAGWTLLRYSGGTLDVTILEKEKDVGGRASSSVVNDGGVERKVEHGLHFFFDYPNFRALLQEIDPSVLDRLKPATAGAVFYTGNGQQPIRVKPIPLPSPFHLLGGLQLSKFAPAPQDKLAVPRLALAAFLFRPERLSPRERRRLDNLSFQDFAAQLGVSGNTYNLPFFKVANRSTFNGPFFSSAYAMLRTLRLVQQNERAQLTCYTDGTTGDVLVAPLRKAFEALGGHIEVGSPVKQIVATPKGVTAVQVDSVAGPAAGPAALALAAAGGDRDADYYIAAMSPGALTPMLSTEVRGLPYFTLMSQLPLNTTVACQLHYDEVVTRPYQDAMFLALPDKTPYSTAIDRAGIWSKGVGGGSVIQLVGEVGVQWKHWKHLPHEQFQKEALQLAIDLVSEIYPAAKGKQPIFQWARLGRPDAAGNSAIAAQKSLSDYVRLSPDSDHLRPSVATPIANLYLAGDYTAHRFGCIGMEGAVVSGMEAANHILRKLHLHQRDLDAMSEPGGFIPAIRAALTWTGLFGRAVGYREAP